MLSTRYLQAKEYLAANGWDLEAGVTEFFAAQDEALQETNAGGRSVGGSADQPGASQSSASEAQSSASEAQPSTSRSAAPKKRFATLGDYTSKSGGAGESSDEDDTEDQDFFAGGEKSGLAVQNPDDIKRKIIEKAQRYGTSAGVHRLADPEC